MPRIPFEDLPDHGRLWVFPSPRALDADEARSLLEETDGFLDGWAAHGAPLRSARELRHGQFLLVGVDEDAEAPSGCSIDALVNTLRRWGGERDLSLIDHSSVWYRTEEGVAVASRPEFKALAEAGAVDAGTVVFDTTLTRIAELRAGGFEAPARERWHGRAFFPEEVGG